jgi:predicted permease
MNDLRFAIRMLAKNPVFTGIALLVLALAIGGNTAMFTLINALALRPISATDPDALVGCYSKENTPDGRFRSFSYPNYSLVKDQNPVFSSVLAYTMTMVGVTEGDLARRTFASVVSANYLSTLGVMLAAGRDFTIDEEKPGSAIPVAIVSHSYWKRMGADPDLVGRTVRLNNHPFTIIGVAPEQFTGTTALFSPEFWVPLGVYELLVADFMNEEKRQLSDPQNHCLMLVGRLKPGLSVESAQGQLDLLSRQLEAADPELNKDRALLLARLSRFSITTNPKQDNTGTLAVVLLSMSGAVLLIACLNLANMLLARGSARRKEIAIRIALGGARFRIIRQLLIEGLLLSLAGGAAGLLLAYSATNLLVASLIPRLPFMGVEFPTSPDWRVLLATLGFCLFSTLLFGLGPAWKLSKSEVIGDLKENAGENPGAGAGRSLFSFRNAIVVAQVALSLALLVAAGLFTRGAIKAASADPGFDMNRGTLVELDAGLAGYDENRGRQLYSSMLERLRALPGVQSAAMAYTVPFGLFSDGATVRRAEDSAAAGGERKATEDGKPISARFNIISTDYFKTLGLPILRGREFDRIEVGPATTEPVAIINDVLAKQLWPGEDPLGRFVRLDDKKQKGESRLLRVVGMVPAVRNDLTEKELQAHVYVPFGSFYRSQMNVHLKTSFGSHEADAAFLKTVRTELRNLDDGLPVLSLQTLRDFHDNGLALWFVRTGARLFSIFGGLALFLAVVGVYGVKSYVIERRTREIGIRMALGATRMNVVWMVLREGGKLTLAGLALGLLLAWGTGQLLGSFLYEVHGADPVVFASVTAILAAAAMLACYLPARRAAKIEPMRALRYE